LEKKGGRIAYKRIVDNEEVAEGDGYIGISVYGCSDPGVLPGLEFEVSRKANPIFWS
jgi:hypothetical protein